MVVLWYFGVVTFLKIMLKNTAICLFTSQLKLVLIYQPRRDGRLSRGRLSRPSNQPVILKYIIIRLQSL